MPFRRPSQTALLLSFIAVLASFWVAKNVYERIPHVEDEFAYIWQAQVFARGQAFIPSPPIPKMLVVPFVVDYRGLRFSKYPPGWSLFLILGVLTRSISWVNPLLAGLGTWLMFRLGQKIFDDLTGLIAAGLMVASPFFLLNSGALLSHPLSLVLCLTLTIAWLDLYFDKANSLNTNVVPYWIKVWVAGLSLGVLALTRPLTAVGVGLPFLIHGISILLHNKKKTRNQILAIGIIAACVALLLPIWQYLLTGNPFQNLYTLWWDYDRIGFGDGVGTQPGGHNLFWVINNLVLSMISGSKDLFGWPGISWLFIPFGLWAARHNKMIEPVIGVPAGLALAYTIYWISPDLYGPRYYYETLVSACLLTAAGIIWLYNLFNTPMWRISAVLIIIMLIGYNLSVYLPARFNSMRNLYNINLAQQLPFMTDSAKTLTPALVIVHAHEWTDCAGLLPLQDPWLSTPFIFGCDINNSMKETGQIEYPDRRTLHYYPGDTHIYVTPQNE